MEEMTEDSFRYIRRIKWGAYCDIVLGLIIIIYGVYILGFVAGIPEYAIDIIELARTISFVLFAFGGYLVASGITTVYYVAKVEGSL